MFLLGLGGKDEKVKQLEKREKDLKDQLSQALGELNSANERFKTAEDASNNLQEQNRVLAARVQRLALQNVELSQNKWQWQQVSEENQSLKKALKKQASTFDSKMSTFKARTKKLMTTILAPGGAPRSSAAAPAPAATAPTLDFVDGAVEAHDGDAAFEDASEGGAEGTAIATAMLQFNDPSVEAAVIDIIDSMYDDAISEDEAVERLAKLQCDLRIAAAPPPAPAPAPAAAGGIAAGPDARALEHAAPSAEANEMQQGHEARAPRREAIAMVDAATDAEELSPPALPEVEQPEAEAEAAPPAGAPAAPPKPQLVDAEAYTDATDYPALLEGVREAVAGGAGVEEEGGSEGAPSADESPRGSVPRLNLAALNQLIGLTDDAAAATPGSPGAQSSRSYASLRSNASFANAEPFLYLSQFVLAQPDKLQRLIQRANNMRAGGAASAGGALEGVGAMPLPAMRALQAMSTFSSAGGAPQPGAADASSKAPQPRIPGGRVFGFGGSSAGAAPAAPAPELLTSAPSASFSADDTKAASDRVRLPAKASGAAGAGPKFAVLPAAGMAPAAGGSGKGAEGPALAPAAASGGIFKGMFSSDAAGDQARAPKIKSMGAAASMLSDMPSMDDDRLGSGSLVLRR